MNFACFNNKIRINQIFCNHHQVVDIFQNNKLVWSESIDISKLDVTVQNLPAETKYTGNQITFNNLEVYVKNGSEQTKLIHETDYVLSYENNINIGTAVVNVNGIGCYSGSKPFIFQIKPVDINDLDISLI